MSAPLPVPTISPRPTRKIVCGVHLGLMAGRARGARQATSEAREGLDVPSSGPTCVSPASHSSARRLAGCQPSGSSAQARWGVRLAVRSSVAAPAWSRRLTVGASEPGGWLRGRAAAVARRSARRPATSCSRSCRRRRRGGRRPSARSCARRRPERRLSGDRARPRCRRGRVDLLVLPVKAGTTRIYLSGAARRRGRGAAVRRRRGGRRRRRGWRGLGGEDEHGIGVQGLGGAADAGAAGGRSLRRARARALRSRRGERRAPDRAASEADPLRRREMHEIARRRQAAAGLIRRCSRRSHWSGPNPRGRGSRPLRERELPEASMFERPTPTRRSGPGRSASARSRSVQATSPIASASSSPAGSVVERLRIEKSG